jgi:hypothetical protein
MEETLPSLFSPPEIEVEALVWCFPVPPIPTVLERSFLFLFAISAICLLDDPSLKVSIEEE